jgi:hypothetical protein
VVDDATEALIAQTFARCVPDEDRRRSIAARVQARELLSSAEVVAARRHIAAASPENLESAATSTSGGAPESGGTYQA